MALSLASADADESSYSRSTPQTDNTPPIPHSSGLMCGGVYKQDDVVGQYLAQRATQQAYFDHVQSFQQGYVTEQAGYLYPGHQHELHCESYGCGYAVPRLPYPDPEHIRHLHTLYSLLPLIQPERKVNALSGPELDIVNGIGHVLCHAVPKKLLVLFLGRTIVSKFLRTTSREDNEAWTGLPTKQLLTLPHGVASKSSITILVSWMTRACKAATMYTMKQLRVPQNLFAACSLAQTLELFGLHKDAFRIDSAIAGHFRHRLIHAIELETLWNCLGENSKYVYGCIRAVNRQIRDGWTSEQMARLCEQHPRLSARMRDANLNEMCKPEFGRRWFADLGSAEGNEHTESPHTASIHVNAESRRKISPSAPSLKHTVA